MPDYVNFVLGLVDKASIKPMKIVGNANFGYGRPARRPHRAGARVRPGHPQLYPGLAPSRRARPTPCPENQRETEELVRTVRAAMGVMWDGDADRVMFIDEKGGVHPRRLLTAMLSKILLENTAGVARSLRPPGGLAYL